MEVKPPNVSGGYYYERKSWNVSALMDITYLRVGLGYTRNYGEESVLGYNDLSGISEKTNGLDISFLNIFALGKYPFMFFNNHIALWPAIGVDYDLNLTAKENNGLYANKDLNDWYVLFGLGLDIFFTPEVALTSSAIFGGNLTPKPTKTKTPGVEYLAHKVDLNIGFLFKL